MDALLTEAINALMDKVHQTAKDKGWWDKPRNNGEMIALMHSELSEALEYLRNDSDEPSDHIPDFTGVEEELADALIRIFDFAAGRGLDLGGALEAKIAFNKERAFRHGGKKF